MNQVHNRVGKTLKHNKYFNPLTTSIPHHIETSQGILIANQLSGFYMMENIVINRLNSSEKELSDPLLQKVCD